MARSFGVKDPLAKPFTHAEHLAAADGAMDYGPAPEILGQRG
jgi:hypothetical protein